VLPSLLLALALPVADTYPRQPLDVEHYTFALVLSDSSNRVDGTATVRMRFTAGGVTQFWLDLAGATPARQGRGMVVQEVRAAGATLAFRHTDDRLTITLPSAVREGERLDVIVRYSGEPADGLQIKPTRNGDRAFFSDNWPDKAHQWLPTVDHVGDKATMEMSVSAPAQYQVVSNGRLVETTDLPGGARRSVWRQGVPISPWLFTLGVTRFAVQHLGDYRGIPLETWVFAPERDKGFYDFAVPVHDAMAFYSERVGPFAYEKLANVQSVATGGGMEAATAIMYDQGSVDGTRRTRWRNVIIHEIAHQWFGNAVTERDWDDVWLSEGFATYFTLLFIEHAYGRDEFAQGLRDSRKTVVDFYARRPDYRVVHDNLADMSQVTTSMTYQKGGWVLHMLRQHMGEDRFWAGIRAYYARYLNRTATTADFRAAMEEASGQDLRAFFDQWLYRGGIPRLEVAWQWDAAARAVVIDWTQVQAGGPFVFPMDISVAGPQGKQLHRFNVDSVRGQVRLPSPMAPGEVIVDPEVRMLLDVTVRRRP
jgi:aminopeptidase N